MIQAIYTKIEKDPHLPTLLDHQPTMNILAAILVNWSTISVLNPNIISLNKAPAAMKAATARFQLCAANQLTIKEFRATGPEKAPENSQLRQFAAWLTQKLPKDSSLNL